MIIKQKYIYIKFIKSFPILFCFLYEIICYTKHTDFDYPMKLRLNNGNYLVMTAQGIYLYNDEFNAKKNITVFGSYLIEDNNKIY